MLTSAISSFWDTDDFCVDMYASVQGMVYQTVVLGFHWHKLQMMQRTPWWQTYDQMGTCIHILLLVECKAQEYRMMPRVPERVTRGGEGNSNNKRKEGIGGTSKRLPRPTTHQWGFWTLSSHTGLNSREGPRWRQRCRSCWCSDNCQGQEVLPDKLVSLKWETSYGGKREN